MTHIVQYSGGIGSFAAAYKLVQAGTPLADIVLLFCDTMIEDPDTYRFLHESAASLGLKVTRIADGRNPWELFRDRKFVGNTRIGLCSSTLKRELAKQWISALHEPEDCILYVGIDWMEAHRFDSAKGFWAPYEVRAPLCEDSTFDKLDFIRFAQQTLKIKEQRLYRDGYPHANCGGFCVKAGQAHFLHLLRNNPELYAWHEEQERLTIAHIQKASPNVRVGSILRDRKGGTTKPLTLERLRLEKGAREQTEDGQHEWGGCGCFNDMADKPTYLALEVKE